MARPRSWQPIPDDPWDKESFGHLLHRFLGWMETMSYSPYTIAHRRHYLTVFIAWCAERSVKRPSEVTRPLLERYREKLHRGRKENGEPVGLASEYAYLEAVKAFFRWVAKQNVLLLNPAADLELPRREWRLPHFVLTAPEADQVINGPDVENPLGLRDRAMLETFYSTGIRRAELTALKVGDVDFERGTVFVRLGKGRKDRLVPIGERALSWLRKYLDEVRPRLARRPDEETLFLTRRGAPLSLAWATFCSRAYIRAAGFEKRGACHIFRHTAATLMLENGADIRYLQEMLGHARFSSTEIYTRVAIRKLKEIHEKTHPARSERETEASPSPLAAEPPQAGPAPRP